MNFPWQQKLSIDEARALAQQICTERGWFFNEPIRISIGLLSWTITTNAMARGANAQIQVSRFDKKVVRAVFLPR